MSRSGEKYRHLTLRICSAMTTSVHTPQIAISALRLYRRNADFGGGVAGVTVAFGGL